MRYPAAGFIWASFSASFLAIGLFATGCESAARYEVAGGGTGRAEIPRNAGAIVTRDKIDYEIFQADEKVIVRFVNRTGQPLKLTEQSFTQDAGGRSFAVEPQELAADESGRVILPPTSAVERVRPAAIPAEVEVGGVDEGGIIGTRRDLQNNDAAGGSISAAAAPPPGFRWPPNARVRLRLVYRVGDSAEDLTHEWSLRRTR
jgi:hypothetical protein